MSHTRIKLIGRTGQPFVVPEDEHLVALSRIAELEAELTDWQRMRNEAMAVATSNRARINELEASAVRSGQIAADDLLHITALAKRVTELEAQNATLTAEVMHYTAGTPHPRVAELEAAANKSELMIGRLVAELRSHTHCGDNYPENGWPEVNTVLAQYASFKRATSETSSEPSEKVRHETGGASQGCPCKGHPFHCFHHPRDCGCANQSGAKS